MTPETFLSSAPPIRLEYWIEGRRLATRDVPALHERFEETSEVFSCNECQSVWAWIYYPNRHWYYVYQDCPRHNTRRYAEANIPGSILSPAGWELDSLPLSVLKWEFEVHFNETVRRYNGNPDSR